MDKWHLGYLGPTNFQSKGVETEIEMSKLDRSH